MKLAGPFLTLAAVAALGGGLLIADYVTGQDHPSATAPTATSPNSPGATTISAFPAQADYVTDIQTASGRPITLSVTVTGAKAVAYACDGVSVETWLSGAASSGRMTLTGNNSNLEAALEGEDLSGTLTLAGKKYEFTAPPVQAPAGLYIARSDSGRDSWIVRPDGSITGVRRKADGSTVPAPDLAPNARKVDGDDSDF
ncbi:hypothetical protein [Nocardia crassostreae]|uniref:hypothetical protein n=1 Tax=Nocardia crassostreae TaxID=53428 RepID=UPI000836D970|nr:hypothetical protein [Nocardia crassostreae]